MGIISTGIKFAIVLAVTAALPGTIRAAPQILGLLATAEPTSLHCEAGVCSAEFSAFCLQENRKIPVPGTAYAPAGKTRLDLVLTAADGRRWRLPAAPHASVESRHSFATVRISLSRRTLEDLGGVAASISVSRLASLIPIAERDDPDPLRAAEIADITGPKRLIASAMVETTADDVIVAQKTVRLINALPARGGVPAARRNARWHDVFGAKPAGDGKPALRRAVAAFEDCRRVVNRRFHPDMRSCLQRYHDDAMVDVTRKVWNALKPGS